MADGKANMEPPRIEFPCDYPVKVMGANDDDFVAMVLEIGRRHAPEISSRDLSTRESRTGRWVSVTLVIRATGEAQLGAIFEDLKATGRIELVL